MDTTETASDPTDLQGATGLAASPTAGDAAADVLQSMVHLIRTTRALAHRQTDELGITGTPLGILKKLGGGDARPSDLACVLQIAPSVVSRAVVPLEKAGLVERRPDPADARAWHLALTDLGRERLSARQAYVNEQFAAIFVDWDPADVTQLAALMHRLDLAIVERSDDLLPHFPLTTTQQHPAQHHSGQHHPAQHHPAQHHPTLQQTRLDQTRLDQTEGPA